MPESKPIRIWVDGCFDTMHYGHSNALRQAKEMGAYLVVGVHSDEEILKNKGPTVLKNKERYDAVRACKWVDEVVEDAPYLTSLEYLDKYNCDFCVHGDDVTTMSDGTDCYSVVKQAGRYKECKRTIGVSTTDLVKRMLLRKINPQGTKAECDHEYIQDKLEKFNDHKVPITEDKVVYVDGSFDMFHAGHAEYLKQARQLGTFLIVGVQSDDLVKEIESTYPILNQEERALSVLACRYADAVILESPRQLTDDFIAKHNINIVVGADQSIKSRTKAETKVIPNQDIGSKSIIERILADFEVYQERNRKKGEKAILEAEMLAKEKATA
ncbi:Ethanolamine-phosphate cytidylyltransferase [Boothiomyces sp. JEL0866]|nr:Ethanolamine-phosphate cytidylyltransferase [Boothiomyces sp. JEL0866]